MRIIRFAICSPVRLDLMRRPRPGRRLRALARDAAPPSALRRRRPPAAERAIELDDRRRAPAAAAARARALPRKGCAARRAPAGSCRARPGSAASRVAPTAPSASTSRSCSARCSVVFVYAARRIRHVAERGVDRPLVVHERLAVDRPPRAGRSPRVRPRVEDRRGRADGWRSRAAPGRSSRSVSARLCAPKKPVRLMRGKVLGLRGADLRVGGDELLLGLADVGPPLEERRRKTGRDRRRPLQRLERTAARARRRARCPSSRLSAFSACAISRSMLAICPVAVNSSCSACRTSSPLATPPARRASVSRRLSVADVARAPGDLQLEIERAQREIRLRSRRRRAS